MVFINLILASAGLLQAVNSRSIPGVKTVLANNIIIPRTKSDFAKNNVTAKWAPRYPKEWGSEDFSYQFGTPDPNDNINGVVTDDEQYLALFNGTHIEFIDLDANSTVSTVSFKAPEGNIAIGLTVRPATQGGYDVITGAAMSRYDDAKLTIRQRVGSDLKPIGEPIQYQGGIGVISLQGLLATTSGYIYDLQTTSSTPISTLDGQPDIYSLSFSPDGVYLSTVSWQTENAFLWNVTSGALIYQFPLTNAQNWLTRFSPDGKYVTIAFGASTNGGPSNVIQFYSLANLTAAPLILKDFNNWPRIMDWDLDSQKVAIGDDGRLRIFTVPSLEIVQTWHVDAVSEIYAPEDIHWLDNGRKITFMWRYGRYLYDFESNTEWLWTVRVSDHSWGYAGFYYLKKKGYAVTKDGDSTVRFWKI